MSIINNYALVKNGVVVNVVVWDGTGNIFDDYVTVILDGELPVEIGWKYDDGQFSPPES